MAPIGQPNSRRSHGTFQEDICARWDICLGNPYSGQAHKQPYGMSNPRHRTSHPTDYAAFTQKCEFLVNAGEAHYF